VSSKAEKVSDRHDVFRARSAPLPPLPFGRTGALHELGVIVRHILSNGAIVGQEEIERQLMDVSGRADDDLFESHDQRRAFAYRDRASREAHAENRPHSRSAAAVR
jgi:hypothetical protein